MSLKVNIRHLEAGEVRLKGDVPAKELDLDGSEELVHVRKPVHYELVAQKTGRSVLVQGKLNLTLDCECARCLKPFEQRLELPDWVAHLSLEGDEKVEIKDDSVDLTHFVREDILLEFPQHPLCEPGCAGLANQPEKDANKTKGASPTPGASVWSELNKLKF